MHLASSDGDLPKNPQAWGWRETSVGTGNPAHVAWRAQGQRIGWVEEEDLFLEPDAAFAAVQELGNQIGEPLPVLSKTLNKRLAEKRPPPLPGLGAKPAYRPPHDRRDAAQRSPYGGQPLPWRIGPIVPFVP